MTVTRLNPGDFTLRCTYDELVVIEFALRDKIMNAKHVYEVNGLRIPEYTKKKIAFWQELIDTVHNV